MSNRLVSGGNVEDDAVALLKAVALMMKGSDVYRAFQALDASAMVRGHAWRAIKAVTRNAMLPKWQRSATPEQAQAMLLSAAEFALKHRKANPSEAFQYPSRGEDLTLGHLGHLVDKYIEGRLLGRSHDEMHRYHLPGRTEVPPPAPPAPRFDIKDRIRALGAEGRHSVEIVKMTGTSRSTVYRTLRTA